MNKNKGIIGLGLVLAIVLGVTVVGGGAYYLGKNKENVNFEKTPENILPTSSEEQNLPIVDNSKKTSITVLSPNGGEKFNATNTIEQIPVSWKSTGITSKNVVIYVENVLNKNEQMPVHIVPDNGSASISTIPPGSYKIKICATYQKKGNLEVEYVPDCSIASDYSDNSFTINSEKTILTTLPKYVGSHSDCGGQTQCWPPIITISSEPYSCNNIGVVPHTEGNEINVQRVINGRNYCIYSISDGYAGGRGYTYTYMISNGLNTKKTTFGLTYPNCGGYGGPGDSQYDECKKVQSDFSAKLDNFIDSLMQSN